MKIVYFQPYKNKGGGPKVIRYVISGAYGKPPKDIFKYDCIRISIGKGCKECGAYIYVTPDEAIDLIRALSASVHHYLVKDKHYQHIIKAKNK